MKQLQSETNEAVTTQACAELLLETAPLIMAVIRAERRRSAPPGLSLPQFRVLLNISRRPGVSLSQVAEEIGLTLPSLSKIVDALVDGGLVTRGESASDRRFLTLHVTPSGESALAVSRAHAQAHLADLLATLSECELGEAARVMRRLAPLFAQALVLSKKVSE